MSHVKRQAVRACAWVDWDEWLEVYEALFEKQNSMKAIDKIAEWRLRKKLPVSVCATATLLEAQKADDHYCFVPRIAGVARGGPLTESLATTKNYPIGANNHVGDGAKSRPLESRHETSTSATKLHARLKTKTSMVPHNEQGASGQDASNPACSFLPAEDRNSHGIRSLYSMAIVRLVNGIADNKQTGEKAKSVSALWAEAGWPAWIADLRHQATHQDLPALSLLRLACHQLLQLLREKYWDPQRELLAEDETRNSNKAGIVPSPKRRKLTSGEAAAKGATDLRIVNAQRKKSESKSSAEIISKHVHLADGAVGTRGGSSREINDQGKEQEMDHHAGTGTRKVVLEQFLKDELDRAKAEISATEKQNLKKLSAKKKQDQQQQANRMKGNKKKNAIANFPCDETGTNLPADGDVSGVHEVDNASNNFDDDPDRLAIVFTRESVNMARVKRLRDFADADVEQILSSLLKERKYALGDLLLFEWFEITSLSQRTKFCQLLLKALNASFRIKAATVEAVDKGMNKEQAFTKPQPSSGEDVEQEFQVREQDSIKLETASRTTNQILSCVRRLCASSVNFEETWTDVCRALLFTEDLALETVEAIVGQYEDKEENVYGNEHPNLLKKADFLLDNYSQQVADCINKGEEEDFRFRDSDTHSTHFEFIDEEEEEFALEQMTRALVERENKRKSSMKRASGLQLDGGDIIDEDCEIEANLLPNDVEKLRSANRRTIRLDEDFVWAPVGTQFRDYLTAPEEVEENACVPGTKKTQENECDRNGGTSFSCLDHGLTDRPPHEMIQGRNLVEYHGKKTRKIDRYEKLFEDSSDEERKKRRTRRKNMDLHNGNIKVGDHDVDEETDIIFDTPTDIVEEEIRAEREQRLVGDKDLAFYAWFQQLEVVPDAENKDVDEGEQEQPGDEASAENVALFL
ncbi:unnamed protein product [Amoebophrya sp. A120]|nr:unnamed protein product [Amoebophrya sp. A120]|eukprot:GSA120T00018578001.1